VPTLRRAAGPAGGLAVALVLLGQARGLDEVARPGQLGPGFWPRLVLVGLALTCAVRLIAVLRGSPARVSPDAVGDAGAGPIDRGVVITGALLIGAYVWAMAWLGFPLATTVFIAAFMRLAGARSATGIGATAALGTAALLYVFVRIVYLPLPKGAGPVEDVTVAVYRTLGIF
jgi:hypothetical protein